MTIKSSFGAVHLDVNPGAKPSAVLDPDAPFRVLLLGDFSGRARKREIVDGLEGPWRSIATISTRCWLGYGPEFAGMRFAELDDFHPDHIYQGEVFQKLREVRGRLETPATFAAAAAEIRAWNEDAATPPAAAPKAAAAAEPQRPELTPGINLLDSIVEAAEPAAPQAPIRRGELRSFVDSVVRPYSVPAEDPELPRLLGLVDAESSARMRTILHHPAFQALEAAWRAVFQLVRAVETGSQLQVVPDGRLQGGARGRPDCGRRSAANRNVAHFGGRDRGDGRRRVERGRRQLFIRADRGRCRNSRPPREDHEFRRCAVSG